MIQFTLQPRPIVILRRKLTFGTPRMTFRSREERGNRHEWSQVPDRVPQAPVAQGMAGQQPPVAQRVLELTDPAEASPAEGGTPASGRLRGPTACSMGILNPFRPTRPSLRHAGAIARSMIESDRRNNRDTTAVSIDDL
jgi:hypothetical protein